MFYQIFKACDLKVKYNCILLYDLSLNMQKGACLIKG